MFRPRREKCGSYISSGGQMLLGSRPVGPVAVEPATELLPQATTKLLPALQGLPERQAACDIPGPSKGIPQPQDSLWRAVKQTFWFSNKTQKYCLKAF